MSRELNKIFDVKSRQARRDILDKFDLSKEDKNKVLNKIDSGDNGSSDDQNELLYYKLIENKNLESDVSNGDYPNVFSECRHVGVLGPLWGTPQWLQSFLGPNFSQPLYADAFVFIPCDYLDRNKQYHRFKTYEELREMIPVLPEATRITKEEYYEGRNIEKL